MNIGIGLGLGVLPMANPAPPRASLLRLNSPASLSNSFAFSDISESTMTAIDTSSGGRRFVSWDIGAGFGYGAVIEFDVTTSHSFYGRLDDDQTLNAPGIIDLTTPIPLPAGSHHVQYIVSGAVAATRPFIGFVMAASGSRFSVTNFRVSPP